MVARCHGEFPAPGAQVWAGVSKMLVQGLSTLHSSARWAALIGLVLGTLSGSFIATWVPTRPLAMVISLVIPADRP